MKKETACPKGKRGKSRSLTEGRDLLLPAKKGSLSRTTIKKAIKEVQRQRSDS